VDALRAWARWGVWVFAVGGALWVLKVAFIALNDVLGRDTDALPVPIFYLTAIFLMAIGATAVGIALVRNRAWWLQLLAAVAGFLGLFVLYTVLDGVFKSAFEDTEPEWLRDELGVVSTGAVCLLAGLWLAWRDDRTVRV
jgi:peptidoglycan/LPS O-acetylase OafA/YrhL